MIAWLLSVSVLAAILIAMVYFVLALVVIVPTWRICQRAGFSGALSLIHLVPLVGSFIVMAVLAFSAWPNGEAAGQGPRLGQGPGQGR